MSTNVTKPLGKRTALAATLLVWGGFALSGLGLATTAEAAPAPAPQAPSSINAGFAEHRCHHHHHFGDPFDPFDPCDPFFNPIAEAA